MAIEPPEGMHRGIELRATLAQVTPGEFLHVNSDALHLIAQLGGPGGNVFESGWVETMPPILDPEGRPWLRIEHRAVMLPDSYPDPEEGP